jgi:hypothetical protein
VWGKASSADGSNDSGQLFSQLTFGLVAVGRLNKSQRNELIDIMRSQEAYKFDMRQAKREIRNGRPVYTIPVTVNPYGYIQTLKKFAPMIGVSRYDAIDPEEYKGVAGISFDMTIDVWSRHISQIRYGNSGRIEALAGYGLVRRTPNLPKESTSIEELQAKVQEISGLQ